MAVQDGMTRDRDIASRAIKPRHLDPTATYVFGGVVLPVKTTTGDPSGQEGQMYVNTADNALRLYADSAWRTVVSW